VNFLDGATVIGSGTLNGSGQTTYSTSGLSVGSHSITAQYLGDTVYQGSTSSVLTQVVNAQPPTISSISSISGNQGTTISANITGTNLLGATSVTFTRTGVTASIQSGGTSTSLPVTITIAPDAAIGQRQFSVTAPGGTSNLFTGFTVNAGKKRSGQITSY
jgi:hypothetical protein